MTALSRGTTTELKYQGSRRGSHYGDQGMGQWPPPLAKPGLSLKRGSKTDADPSEGTTPRGGT